VIVPTLLLALSPQSSPCFDPTGGPGGDFDLVVHDGEVLFFDTTQTILVGGPGGLPTTTQNAVNGFIEVRHLIIEAGGTLRAQGPNPVHIQATGDVAIRGTLDVSGFAGRDVATLNTGHIVEVGGPGGPGGGRGGNANVVTNASSPRGGAGLGAFGLPGAGGQGGESGYSPASDKNSRRPGGGGGGRFARDQSSRLALLPGVLSEQFALAATAGGDGNSSSTGAESGSQPALGGLTGIGPFVDDEPRNDFWGVRPVTFAGHVTLMRGELPALWAGAGGGGGGNAIPAGTFPNPSWTIGSDEKGGPGGGGGGSLHVQALGRIVFGAAGTILSNGARGGTGENTNFLDHIGGTGASGSGGHVVLESETQIDFTDGGANDAALPRAWLQALGHAAHQGIQTWVDPCCGENSTGGAGSAGVVQLHVPDPMAAPLASPGALIRVPLALAAERGPLELVAAPAPIVAYQTCRGGQGLGAPRVGPAGAGASRSALQDLLPAKALEVPIRY
jgi:hypothetical protein